MSDSSGSGSRIGGKIVTFLIVATLAWLAAGTEWSLAFEKEGFLHGIAIEDVARSGDDACSATIDFAGVPQRPSSVTVHRASGDEALALEDGRGTLTYPRPGGMVELRLAYVGVLHKPSYADVSLAQDGCRLQPTAFRSMPILPF